MKNLLNDNINNIIKLYINLKNLKLSIFCIIKKGRFQF